MSKRPGWLLLGLIMVGLLVSGCQKKTEDADAHKISYSETTKESSSSRDQQSSSDAESDESTRSSSTSSSASASSSSSAAVALWNTAKANQLADFMVQWGQSMGQKYEVCTPQSKWGWYGTDAYRTWIAANRVAVANDSQGRGDQHVSVVWSNDGRGSAQYKIVAAYTDSVYAKYPSAHLYLFTIGPSGQPIVLITMQNQGAPDDLLHFWPTENSALQNGFSTIIKTTH